MRRPRLGERQFGGVEFIAPDVLFKTTKVEATKNRGYAVRCFSGD